MDTDVVVVGAGPAGLRAAARLAQEGARVRVLYQGLVGGELQSVPWVEDPRFASQGMSGLELSEQLSEAAMQAGVRFHAAPVIGVEAYEECACVLLAHEQFLSARAVILATGTQPRRIAGLDLAAYDNLGVIGCVPCDAIFYEYASVAVCGGGHGGAGDALHLARYASKVYLVEKDGQLHCDAARQQAIRNTPNIEVLLNSTIAAVAGEPAIESLKVSGADGRVRTLDAWGLSVHVGRTANTALVGAAAQLDSEGFIETDAVGRTSAPNVYAIGDARSGSPRTIHDALADADRCADTVLARLHAPLSA